MSAVNPLSAEFLYELYATALRQEPLCAVLARHMHKEYLPDRSFQRVQEAIAAHFRTYKAPPSYAVLAQTFHEDYDAIELIDTFREYGRGTECRGDDRHAGVLHQGGPVAVGLCGGRETV